MSKLFSLLFALACLSTSIVSASIVGAGLWFWVIIFVGVFVAISQCMSNAPLMLKGAGAGLALLLSFISIAAILLGLLAGAIGGAFSLDASEALLLFLFFLIAVFGFIVAIRHKRKIKEHC